MDGFWKEVKSTPSRYLPALLEALNDPLNAAYFAYDGSKLLLESSQEPADRQLALQTIPRANLRGIQHTNYLRTVHWFAVEGFDTTQAALRILDYPKFQGFIVQHALTLDQIYSLIFMLFSMINVDFVPALLGRLNLETNPISRKSILLALWYKMEETAQAAVKGFIANETKPQEVRDYANGLQARTAPLTGYRSISSEGELRQERMKALRRISDEALIEFNGLTAKILAKQ